MNWNLLSFVALLLAGVVFFSSHNHPALVHQKHWHGATPTTAMTHIAIQEQLDGKAVDWLEKIRNEQYRG